MHFRIELVCKHDDGADAPSIYLVSDGRVILQGCKVSEQDRESLMLPSDAAFISVDRNLIRAIKEML